MGSRAIVVLLFVAAGLGAVLYWTDAKPPAKVVAETALLDGRSLRDCERLWWQMRDRPPIEITRRKDGAFQISEPFVDLASAARLKAIVDAWDSAQVRATPLADDDDGRRKAGLVTPELKFRAEWPGGAHIEVEIGDPGPLGTTRYLRRLDKIWEGGNGLLENMHVGLDDLRERQVFRHAFAQADELRVDQQLPSGKRETLHLERVEDGWRLLAPVQGRASPDAAQRFVTAVLTLRVDEFPAGVIRLPETEPALVIKVRGAAGEEEVRVWMQNGQIYGMLPGRGVAFVSDNRSYEAVFVNAAEQLRARILLPFPNGAFESLVDIVIDPGEQRGDRIRLSRSAPTSDWRLLEPVEFAAAATACSELASAINRLVVVEFVADADGPRPRAKDPRYGLQAEAGRLSLAVRGFEDRLATTLWLGSQTGEEQRIYACRADELDNVVLVPLDPVATVRRAWTEYCALTVLRQGAVIERLDLERGGERRRFEVAEAGWRLVGAAADRREVGQFANDVLRDLVGRRAIDLRSGALGPPSWTVLLGRRNDDELGSFRVWDRGPDQDLVVQAGDPGPVGFELDKRTSTELRALWQ